mmetsp:Transcript_2405/g.5094  ORF Transcript_2405/g.5094 Transcript_2405/m.5094 type:complete len:211 (-) Transcript_2405:358-990(-)
MPRSSSSEEAAFPLFGRDNSPAGSRCLALPSLSSTEASTLSGDGGLSFDPLRGRTCVPQYFFPYDLDELRSFTVNRMADFPSFASSSDFTTAYVHLPSDLRMNAPSPNLSCSIIDDASSLSEIISRCFPESPILYSGGGGDGDGDLGGGGGGGGGVGATRSLDVDLVLDLDLERSRPYIAAEPLVPIFAMDDDKSSPSASSSSSSSSLSE